ncbi:hypothetical protein JEZ13_04235 [bacterium]|nr:hypothetical protein [bacterium]MBI9072932.1 hypothetical protein [Melioribacteraceae bacterium]
MSWLKSKKSSVPKPPIKPVWNAVDSFIIGAIIVVSLIGFTFADALTRGALIAGYSTCIGAIFVLYQFPRFKTIFMRYKRIFDACLLLASFFLITSNFVFLVLTFGGFLFSGLTAVLKYWGDKKQYKSDYSNYRVAISK